LKHYHGHPNPVLGRAFGTHRDKRDRIDDLRWCRCARSDDPQGPSHSDSCP